MLKKQFHPSPPVILWSLTSMYSSWNFLVLPLFHFSSDPTPFSFVHFAAFAQISPLPTTDPMDPGITKQNYWARLTWLLPHRAKAHGSACWWSGGHLAQIPFLVKSSTCLGNRGKQERCQTQRQGIEDLFSKTLCWRFTTIGHTYLHTCMFPSVFKIWCIIYICKKYAICI